jgi:hypothetical protein
MPKSDASFGNNASVTRKDIPLAKAARESDAIAPRGMEIDVECMEKSCRGLHPGKEQMEFKIASALMPTSSRLRIVTEEKILCLAQA